MKIEVGYFIVRFRSAQIYSKKKEAEGAVQKLRYFIKNISEDLKNIVYKNPFMEVKQCL